MYCKKKSLYGVHKSELLGVEFKEFYSIFKARSIAGAEIIFYRLDACGVVFTTQYSMVVRRLVITSRLHINCDT